MFRILYHEIWRELKNSFVSGYKIVSDHVGMVLRVKRAKRVKKNQNYLNDIYINPLKRRSSTPISNRFHRYDRYHKSSPTKTGPRFCKKKASLKVRKERKVIRFWKSICKMGLKKYQFLTVCLAGEKYRCEVAEIEDYKVFLFIEGRSYQSMADVGFYSLKNIKKMVCDRGTLGSYGTQ